VRYNLAGVNLERKPSTLLLVTDEWLFRMDTLSMTLLPKYSSGPAGNRCMIATKMMLHMFQAGSGLV
jgi:hypothetical protein